MKKIVSIVVFGVAILLSSCGKDPGPAGPKGEAGAQGPEVRGVPRAFRAYPGLKDRRERRGLKGRLAIPVQKATQETLEP